jgi:hypothetical protein
MKSQRVTGKYCARCGKVQPREAFGLYTGNSDGLTDYCRKHVNQASNDSYHKHADERRRKRRERYAKEKNQQTDMFTALATGPRCPHCLKLLAHYELSLGVCLKHRSKRAAAIAGTD